MVAGPDYVRSDSFPTSKSCRCPEKPSLSSLSDQGITQKTEEVVFLPHSVAKSQTDDLCIVFVQQAVTLTK